jgi:hypothetical protein
MNDPSKYIVVFITYLILRVHFSSHSAYVLEKAFAKKEIIDRRITLNMFVSTSLKITSLFITIVL